MLDRYSQVADVAAFQGEIRRVMIETTRERCPNFDRPRTIEHTSLDAEDVTVDGKRLRGSRTNHERIIALQIDGVFYDDHYLEVSNGAGTYQDSYSTHNARVTWQSASESVRIAGWVKNLADEEYKSYALDLGILGATATYAPPRMYGLTASYHF